MGYSRGAPVDFVSCLIKRLEYRPKPDTHDRTIHIDKDICGFWNIKMVNRAADSMCVGDGYWG